MKKERISEILTVLVFALLALGVFQIHPFLVVLAMTATFIYILYRNDNEFEQRSRMESNQLANRVKTTASDAYLKQKRLYTLVANIPLPLVLLNIDGKVVLYNSFFEVFRDNKDDRELTYNKNDFEKDIHKFVNDAFIFERNIDKTMSVKGKEYQAISVPITTEGKFSGCVVLFQDISKAKEKEQMQKEFIADASHELKTPISAIKGMIEILNRDSFDDEEIRKEFMIQIQKENDRLEAIVRDLLQLSRLSSDVLVLKRDSMDFTRILDASISSLQQKAENKGLKIVADYQTHEDVFVDFEQMEVVVNNLLNNAIAYSDSGTITLRTYKKDDYYVFEIQDEGRGLSEENTHKIFERFYRVDKARSRLSGGSGLGLSIVKSILEAHNAILEVESEENKGSVFRILIKY
ncbi:two-component system phosphate regulon sensor histidine kinase PhoR [Breznakia sp. PF5-3]|uniref:sensor histidine kinase n=1 Tax=unclassified Breznakia TaxID=2623764 RepID=UPI0024069897|nr:MULTISPECIES: ATP-binding protein [unclassified Breznakia]MDL2276076.1 sensor histidine kinase [Breznakia sp. OttesenSCG-928-G09]MDF9825094.1 two-component system phosphate regulon sensor histidine kinase PhoR [Breznakia sp. PM6-1]MDF9835929.1 two-component system phosphate regulon sensor histidine kinase PhoR [Breznakia sp. PF5-3]MDF9837469.1 two-component system phosphate regulon sensor histidine kinase PhoR [Breznakia sp. PFB2-8]MDF9859468.1 two-component system phosphate regulon sensor 